VFLLELLELPYIFCEILCYHSIVAEDAKCVGMLRRFDW